MSDHDDLLRELAGVRRDLEDLEEEVSTAVGAMPKDSKLADAGRRNFMVVLQRLENVEDLAADAADDLRSILKQMD